MILSIYGLSCGPPIIIEVLKEDLDEFKNVVMVHPNMDEVVVHYHKYQDIHFHKYTCIRLTQSISLKFWLSHLLLLWFYDIFRV